MEYNNQEDFDMLEQATPSMLISAECRNAFDAPASQYWGVRLERGGAIMAYPVLQQMTKEAAKASDLVTVPTYTIAEMLAMYRERTGIPAMYEPAYQILANAMARYLDTLEPNVAATRDIKVTGQVTGRTSEQSVLSYNWCRELFRAFPNIGTTSALVWLTRELTGNPIALKRRNGVTQEDLDQYRVIPAYQESQILACIHPHIVEWHRVNSATDGATDRYVLIQTQSQDSNVPQITYQSPVFPNYAKLDGLASHWLNVHRMQQSYLMSEQE